MSSAPETCDEIVPEVPVTAEADFAPLQELGPTERAARFGCVPLADSRTSEEK